MQRQRPLHPARSHRSNNPPRPHHPASVPRSACVYSILSTHHGPEKSPRENISQNMKVSEVDTGRRAQPEGARERRPDIWYLPCHILGAKSADAAPAPSAIALPKLRPAFHPQPHSFIYLGPSTQHGPEKSPRQTHIPARVYFECMYAGISRASQTRTAWNLTPVARQSTHTGVTSVRARRRALPARSYEFYVPFNVSRPMRNIAPAPWCASPAETTPSSGGRTPFPPGSPRGVR